MVSKEYYIKVDGQKVPVTEEVYYEYYRPIWRERKKKPLRVEKELSLELFMEDGVEISSNDAPVDEIVEDKLMLDMLHKALNELDDDERYLINEIFFQNKSERVVATERGVKRNTIVYHKNRILNKLKTII